MAPLKMNPIKKQITDLERLEAALGGTKEAKLQWLGLMRREVVELLNSIKQEIESLEKEASSLPPGSRLWPCPFCGTKKTDIVDNTAGVSMHSYPGGYRIECEKCGATGPWDNEDPVRALNLWDNRAPHL